MRVTNNMLITTMMRNLNNNLSRMEKYQTQLSTGKKIQRPSDDPVRASRALKLRTDLQKLEQYERNADNALSWVDITESALSDVEDVLQRARELAVRVANGSLTTDDKQKISAEMEQLKKQLISTGNTNYAGRYIFSGFHTDEKLFNEDGTYNIDVTSGTLDRKPVTTYEVGVGEDIQVSTNGIDVFGYNEINSTIAKMSFGEDKGKSAEKAILRSENPFDFSYDFASAGVAGAGVQINIDSDPDSFIIGAAELNSINGATKESIINTIGDIQNTGGVKLREVASIYFDVENKLVIESDNYGDSEQVDLTFTPTASTEADDLKNAIFGNTNSSVTESKSGSKPVECLVKSQENLTDGDIDIDTFEDTEFLFNLNGESHRISVGTLPGGTVQDLVDELQAELNSKFGVDEIIVNKADDDGDVTYYSLTFTTNTSTPYDDSVPSLSVDVVRSTESTLIKDFENGIAAMNTGDEDEISEFLGKLDVHINNTLAITADIGARVNRLELLQNRIYDDELTYTELLSKNEDADLAEVIMKLQNNENVYRASLSTGAKVIQPTLIDFIR